MIPLPFTALFPHELPLSEGARETNKIVGTSACPTRKIMDVGAAAFVVHAFLPVTSEFTRIGYRGTFIPNARSPFHAEIAALLGAVEWVSELARCNGRR